MPRRSFCEIYVHLVWRTKYSRRILNGELELFVHRRLREIGEELSLSPIAVNSAWDHVHSYYRWSPLIAVAEGVRILKSKTAVEWNKSIRSGKRFGRELKWQRGYGAVSTRKSCVPSVQNYIATQKKRHQKQRVIERFERVEFFDETPPSAAI